VRLGQGEVQCTRLGPRLPGRHDRDADMARQGDARQRSLETDIIGLDQQTDVELGGGVVAALGSNLT